MSSPNFECAKCGYVGPPEPNKAGCPKCGGAWKKVFVEEFGVGKDTVTSLEITSPTLTDKELDSILRLEMKRYLQDRLSAVKVTKVDVGKGIEDVKLRASKLISEAEFASAATAWVALRSQEQQENLQEQQVNLNLRLQRLIALLAIATLVTGFLSVVLPYIYPR
jgi:uncharacterized protein (UPF0212 family)